MCYNFFFSAEFGAHLLSPLERRISELDREKIELQTERDRNAKDIENLTQRVATLQRQLTSYQVMIFEYYINNDSEY